MAETNVSKQLPPEVLEKIFKHCTNLNELLNIVDVCQLWRDVAVREYNRSGNDLVIRRPDDINNLVSLLCKPVSFTKLHIVWDVPSNEDCSSGVSQMCDVIENAYKKQIKFSTNPFQYLTARLFRRTLPRHVDCSSVSLTQLQSFTFRVEDADKGGHSRLLAALLTLILQTSTDTLTHFKLINTRWEQIAGSKTVELLEACQHLSHLVLNGCTLQGYGHRCVDIIPTLTHLELLDLRSTEVSNNLSFIEAVKRGCPNISNNIMIGWLQVRPSDDVNMLQFVSHVDRLVIEDFDTAQLRSLISCLNEHVSQLSVDELWVSQCKAHLTDDILLSLVQRLRGLKDIDVFGCHRLTNEGVVNVITSSPDLEEIEINGIQNIDKDIIQLLDRVVTKKNVHIDAHWDTILSDEMRSNPERELYTGKNRNICLDYRLPTHCVW